VDELQEGDKVRESQERLLQCLQTYTIARCPESPSKFGELLLKIPELQRICQVNESENKPVARVATVRVLCHGEFKLGFN